MSALTERTMLDAMEMIDAVGSAPRRMIVSTEAVAALRAACEFMGRDRRRIKREVNKAIRAFRRFKRALP